MKEIQKIFPDQAEVRTVAEPIKEKKYFGTLKVPRGHKIFKLDLKSGKISEIEPNFKEEKRYNNGAIDYKIVRKEGEKYVQSSNILQKKKVMKLDHQEDVLYCSALNKKNAEKRFAKMMN